MNLSTQRQNPYFADSRQSGSHLILGLAGLVPTSRLTGRDLLRLEVKEQNAIADACGVVGLGNLERHKAALRGDHWI